MTNKVTQKDNIIIQKDNIMTNRVTQKDNIMTNKVTQKGFEGAPCATDKNVLIGNNNIVKILNTDEVFPDGLILLDFEEKSDGDKLILTALFGHLRVSDFEFLEVQRYLEKLFKANHVYKFWSVFELGYFKEKLKITKIDYTNRKLSPYAPNEEYLREKLVEIIFQEI